VFFIDPDGMEATPPDEYVFNRNGTFKEKIEKPGTTYRIDKTNVTIQFANSINDPKAIDNGTITVTVSDSAINNELKIQVFLMKQTKIADIAFIQNESNASSMEGTGKWIMLLTI
jgi:hypothetical protein